MISQQEKVINFKKEPIRKTQLYFIHEGTINGQRCIAKLFNQQVIDKYGLDQILQYHLEVFSASPNFLYPEHFLHIEATSTQQEAVIMMTKIYDCRLDQFIKRGPKKQKQALEIFDHIFKAVYALIFEGYWHRNIRPEHFVKVGNTWKMQSVVFEEQANNEGLNSEYLANPEYRPPEAYERSNFTEEQLNHRVVWDLGCILISLLVGGHRLKNQLALEKFRNQPFSFKALGAAAVDKTVSPQLKEILGKMCHYDFKKRLTFPELLLGGYFSKQVAKHYRTYKQQQKKNSKIFVGSSSSISQSISHSKDKVPVKTKQLQLPPDFKGMLKKSQKRQLEMSTIEKDEKIIDSAGFTNKVATIMQEQNDWSSIIKKDQNLAKLSKQQLDFILDFYKNYLDKGEILAIGGKKFQKMLPLFSKNTQIGQDLIKVTQYALKFVQVMDLCKLARAMNQNKEFFDFNKKIWQAFHGSSEYNAIKQMVNSKKNSQSKVLQIFKSRITGANKNQFVVEKNRIKQFVQRYSPENVQFADIKQPYRKLLKISYDTIAEHYTKDKTQQWAKLGMYITFCLAVDKFYIPEDFKSNFKFYFAWSKKEPSNFVSLHDFQDYLDNAPRVQLVQNSRYIMQKYFQV